MRLRSCEDPNQGLQSREERRTSKHRILPSSFLGDSERMSRYEKEGQDSKRRSEQAMMSKEGPSRRGKARRKTHPPFACTVLATHGISSDCLLQNRACSSKLKIKRPEGGIVMITEKLDGRNKGKKEKREKENQGKGTKERS